MKSIQNTDLKLIGGGRTAEVFDLGQGLVLKLFKPGIPLSKIRQELLSSQKIHSMGIPGPKAYELVQCSDRYGYTMDKVMGDTLEALIRKESDRRDRLIGRFAEALRSLHRIKVPGTAHLPDVRQHSMEVSAQVNPAFCSSAEQARLQAVFESIPESQGFVHGDGHTGNAMLHGDHLFFIDFALSGKGHPVFDLLCMYSHYVFLPSFDSDQKCIQKLGADKKGAEEIYEKFLQAYDPAASVEDLVRLKEWIRGVHAARLVLASVVMPGAFPEEVLNAAKERALILYTKNNLIRYSESI